MWKKSLRKVLCVSYGLMAAQQLSGISAIVFYGIVIFKAADVEMNSLTQNAILGTVQVMACLMTDYLVDKVHRKNERCGPTRSRDLEQNFIFSQNLSTIINILGINFSR